MNLTKENNKMQKKKKKLKARTHKKKIIILIIYSIPCIQNQYVYDFILQWSTSWYRLFSKSKPRVPVYMYTFVLSYYAIPEANISLMRLISSKNKSFCCPLVSYLNCHPLFLEVKWMYLCMCLHVACVCLLRRCCVVGRT